jgi:hypothetical protein
MRATTFKLSLVKCLAAALPEPDELPVIKTVFFMDGVSQSRSKCHRNR